MTNRGHNSKWRDCLTLGALLCFVLLFSIASTAQTCGLPGNNGPGGTISGVVNTYFPATANANAGGKNITLGAYNSAGAGTGIAIGDLVLIIQMQNATINSNNTSAYGANNGTGSGDTGGTAGQYEFDVAASAVTTAGGTLTLATALVNSYTATAATGAHGQYSFQVVRVPQYSSATLGSVTAAPWSTANTATPYNSSSGGIVAIDVAGNLNLGSGVIDVSGLGFRGGGGLSLQGGSGNNTDYVTTSTAGDGGSKGEGIAGTPMYVFQAPTTVIQNTPEGYPNGSFDRGAPGNAGGGGTDGAPASNADNTGGGGGSNGGAGGQGGNAWSQPLDTDGGLGGAAFPATSAKVVMGGGGGAGTENNDPGQTYLASGGAGGGIIIVRAGSVSGSGTMNSNGATGQSPANDGAGGGGAGGSVIVAVKTGTLSGLAINANGGTGGNAWPTDTGGSADYHGPGGGGGGGTVLQSGGAIVSVNGGANGTTTTDLAPYGATSGATGVSSSIGTVPGTQSGAACVPVLTVTKTTTTPTVVQNTAATYVITVKNAASGVAAATQVNISDTLPEPVTNGFTYKADVSIAVSGTGTSRTSTTEPTVGAVAPNWGVFTIAAGGQVVVTFTATVSYGVPPNTYLNPATATYLDPTRTTTNGTTSSSFPAGAGVAVTAAVGISGFVYTDANHNGTLDSGETWTGGTVYVNLVQGGAVVQSATVTAGTGAYAFNGMAAGNYTVVLANSATATTGATPAGWICTSSGPVPSLSFTIGSTGFVNQNFGLFQGGKVSGKAFMDNGAGSGTANDGKLNGSEPGQASVVLTATNGSGTTYDTETTDGAGNYTIWIPSAATSVTIAETPTTGHLATGADPGTTAGTYTRSTESLSFTNTAGTIYTGVNFGDVPFNTFAPDNAASGMPGTSLYYAHTFTALSGGQVVFSTTAVASPAQNNFTEVLFHDANCNGTLDSGDTQIAAGTSFTVVQGGTFCIIVKEMIGAAAALGSGNSITVTAQFTYTNASPALSATYVHTDITTVGSATAAGLSLLKAVNKTSAGPGVTLIYTITFSNDSSGLLSNVVINDMTPTFTTFVSAACVTPLPNNLTACAVTTQPGVGGTGSIRWTLTGTLAPSASGQVTFSVQIL